jgi:two-component system, NarL family, response regulator YdfI
MAMNILVMVVATGAIARSGLSAMITAHPEMTLVGNVSDLDELAAAIERLVPDIILLDLGNLPPTSVWEKLTVIQSEAARSLPILIIDDFDRLDLVVALRAGIRGILAETSTEAELLAAVSAVALGLVVFTPEAIDSFVRESHSIGYRQDSDNLEFSLTPREIEVLVRLGSGLGNKAIAQGLQISEHTVKFHISSIFQKLGVSTRTEAVAMGIRMGLILL